ncbi:MAG TPA: hypothetical protein DG753_07750 [Clostridium sp.]|nr:hypothetical protein [Clostridium sp.]
MNNKIIIKSNTIIPLLKIITSHLNKLDYKFKKISQKLNSISNYIFNNDPYLFDETRQSNTIYTLKEPYYYKNNTDLRLIEFRRTFL